VAGNDRLLLEPAFNDRYLRDTKFIIVHGGDLYSAHAGDAVEAERFIWAALDDSLVQYPERERLHSSRGAKTGLLFVQIKVPSLRQVEVLLHALQVLLLLPSPPRAAILLLVH
jgi:hypothetical protein